MARGERQEDSVRGGVGTMTRPGRRPAAAPPPEARPAPADPRRGRRPGPVTPAAVPPRPASASPDVALRPDAPLRPRPARPRPGDGRVGGAPWRVPPAERRTGPQPAAPSAAPPAVPATATGLGTAPDLAPVSLPGQPAPAPRPRPAGVAGSHRMPFVLLLCGLLGGALISALVISTTLAAGSFQITKLQNVTSSLAKQRQDLQEQVAQAQSPQVIEQRASKLGMRLQQELLFVDLKSGKTTNDGPTWSGAVDAPGYAP
jgi:hypothetical protein